MLDHVSIESKHLGHLSLQLDPTFSKQNLEKLAPYYTTTDKGYKKPIMLVD